MKEYIVSIGAYIRNKNEMVKRKKKKKKEKERALTLVKVHIMDTTKVLENKPETQWLIT